MMENWVFALEIVSQTKLRYVFYHLKKMYILILASATGLRTIHNRECTHQCQSEKKASGINH